MGSKKDIWGKIKHDDIKFIDIHSKWSMLENYWNIRHNLPDDWRECVYILLISNIPIYIGATSDYRKRLKIHLSSISFDIILIINTKECWRLEEELINYYKPVFNVLHFTKYENCKMHTYLEMLELCISNLSKYDYKEMI